MLRVLSPGVLAPSLHIARRARLLRARPASSSAAEQGDPVRPALLQLRQAYLPPPAAAAPVSLTISDAPECWAIVGGDGDGERVVEALRDVMTGRRRARTADGKPVSSTHPFLGARSPAEHVVHVSFAARAAAGGEFVDYAVRYGAVRDDEDAVTLYEGCMRALGHHTGRAARLACVADVLAAPSSIDQAKPGAPTDAERAAGRAAHQCITETAPLLRLDRPPPAEESNGDTAALLHTPLIRLSNGQMRRARLLEALVRCRLSPAADRTLLVLSQPYNGLDPPTRTLLSSILAARHGASDPRIVLFLRVQDEIPAYITHVAQVHDDGAVQAGPRALVQQQLEQDSRGGYALLKQSAAQASPAEGEPLVSLRGVDIKYAGKSALESIALDVHRGARMVLAGFNGSGKSTLLSLILGDHPQSFALPEQKLSLFGKARDAPGNATLLLARRIGHVSPELFNAFPRKDSERGGMTVGEAIGSGYSGVFSRRPLNDQQKARIWRLLAAFQDVIDAPDGNAAHASRQSSASAGSRAADDASDPLAQAKRLASASFAAMSLGSQSIVLLLRAIVHGPSLLILDEPFQHQSARQVERARAFLDEPEHYAIGETEQDRAQDAEARRAMSLILVSHYEAEWPRSMNALLRLEAGRVSERIGQC